MVALLVKFYGPNDESIPEDWPKDVKEVGNSIPTPPGYTRMTRGEYDAYVAAHKGSFDSTTAPRRLEEAKADRKAVLSDLVLSFVEDHYPLRVQTLLNMLLLEGLDRRFPQRNAYIEQAVGWIKKALTSDAQAQITIDACRTIDDVSAVMIDFAPYADGDPKIDLNVALAMTS